MLKPKKPSELKLVTQLDQIPTAQLEKTLDSSRTWLRPPRRSDFSLRGHVLPSSTSRGHVSRGHRVTTASRNCRRSNLRIARPNRNSIALSIFTANIFGALIPERIDRHGEISSTTVHRKHPRESIACIITLSAGEVHSPPTRTQATEPRLKRRNKKQAR